MKDWWFSLQPRERLMIAGCGAVIAIALLYVMVWAPLAEARAQAALNVKAQQETLSWMRQASLQVRQARQTVPTATVIGDNRSLLSIVDSSATQAGVREPIVRMEPEGDNGVTLSMDNAEFDAVILWLGALKRGYNVDVVQVSITPTNTPGRVDTSLSLQRP
jgi:general secretion pathway protein M